MKVLLINNFHYRKGGSEAVYFNTAEILRKYGHEVIFFSYHDEQNASCSQSDYFVSRKGTLGTIKDYFYNKEAERKLERLVKEERPDIAHVHLFWGGLSPSIFKALHKYHVPMVHTAHDYRMVCPGYTFKNGKGELCEKCGRSSYYECAIHRCAKGSLVQSLLMATEMYSRQWFFNPLENINGFIFVSHFAENKHLEHNCKFAEADRTVIYNYTTPILKRNREEKKNYYLYYGRLSFEKGVPTLLKVFAKHPELQLVVVGTGALEKSLKDKYGAFGNIRFEGYQSGKALFELVRHAKFVCVPSEWYENNPMTIIEAYSMGTPVIGTRMGGIPEIVEDGVTGKLFDAGDEDSLKQAIVQTSLIDEKSYQNMCDKAYSFYENHFSEESYYLQLMNFYNKIINKKIQ